MSRTPPVRWSSLPRDSDPMASQNQNAVTGVRIGADASEFPVEVHFDRAWLYLRVADGSVVPAPVLAFDLIVSDRAVKIVRVVSGCGVWSDVVARPPGDLYWVVGGDAFRFFGVLHCVGAYLASCGPTVSSDGQSIHEQIDLACLANFIHQSTPNGRPLSKNEAVGVVERLAKRPVVSAERSVGTRRSWSFDHVELTNAELGRLQAHGFDETTSAVGEPVRAADLRRLAELERELATLRQRLQPPLPSGQSGRIIHLD